MKVRAIQHVGPRRVEFAERSIAPPEPGEVLVQSEVSAISPGTESMIFRGELPSGIAVDETIAALRDQAWSYPLRYGYALVGRVVRAGSRAEEPWVGKRVFVFHPHQDQACVAAADCLPVPEQLDSRAAAMLPNVDAAINFVQDARPLLGERLLVTGQGVVGLLTTAMLAAFPLATLAAVDPVPGRRLWAERLGTDTTADSVSGLLLPRADQTAAPEPFDAVIELSGNIDALDQVLTVTGFDGRIVVGSWYGKPGRSLDLGGVFHRRRIRLISSQVSTIAPDLTGRWAKARRLALAWQWIGRIAPQRLVTQVLPAARCQQAFELAAAPEAGALQVLLEY